MFGMVARLRALPRAIPARSPLTSSEIKAPTLVKPPTRVGLGSVLLLVSLTIVYLANNATWTYLELIAKASGLVGDQVGSAIAIGQLVSVAALLVLAISTAALVTAHDTLSMTAIVAGIMGALSSLVTLYLAILALSDLSGRLVV